MNEQRERDGGGVMLLKGGWGRVETTKVQKVGAEEEEEQEGGDNGLSF